MYVSVIVFHTYMYVQWHCLYICNNSHTQMDTAKWNVCLRLSLAIPDSEVCDPFKQCPLMCVHAFNSLAPHGSVSIDLFQHHTISSYW